MVESMVVECLVTTCPMPDHTLSDGAEVGRYRENDGPREQDEEKPLRLFSNSQLVATLHRSISVLGHPR